MSPLFRLIGGLIDYLTIVLMFAGLRERLHDHVLARSSSMDDSPLELPSV